MVATLTRDEMEQKAHAHYAKRGGGSAYLGELPASAAGSPPEASCAHGGRGEPRSIPLRREAMSFGAGSPAGVVPAGSVLLYEGKCPDCGLTLYAIAT